MVCCLNRVADVYKAHPPQSGGLANGSSPVCPRSGGRQFPGKSFLPCERGGEDVFVASFFFFFLDICFLRDLLLTSTELRLYLARKTLTPQDLCEPTPPPRTPIDHIVGYKNPPSHPHVLAFGGGIAQTGTNTTSRVFNRGDRTRDAKPRTQTTQNSELRTQNPDNSDNFELRQPRQTKIQNSHNSELQVSLLSSLQWRGERESLVSPFLLFCILALVPPSAKGTYIYFKLFAQSK